MLKMKRTLAILLALCFLMSVTVAAVSADAVTPVGPGSNSTTHGDHNQKPGDHNQKPGDHNQKPGDHNQKPGDHNQKPGDHNQKPGDHKDGKKIGHKDGKRIIVIEKPHKEFHKGKWVPGHYEFKMVKKVVYKHHHKIVIKEFIKVWVPGHWIQFHHFR